MLVENLAGYEEALAFGQGLEPSLLTAQILPLLATAAAQLGNECLFHDRAPVDDRRRQSGGTAPR